MGNAAQIIVKSGLAGKVDLFFKRLFDILASALGLLMLSPLFILIAMGIKFDSPGPVFYRGERVGLRGRRFRIFKFRTMVRNAEKLGGTTTGENDPRVTRMGRFLRGRKLDELPQLLNVLIGDMSLVGPRPEVPEYADRYTGEEKLILSVRPGITDWSSLRFIDLQAHVGSDDPDAAFREKVLPEKNRLRLEYVRDRSFWTDMKILWLTLMRVVGMGEGGRG